MQEFLMNIRCSHLTDRSFAKSHNGLCRKCHSNFSFLLDMEEKFGEDVIVEYWYGMILIRLSDDKQHNVLLNISQAFILKNCWRSPPGNSHIYKKCSIC